jgi:hypothetical protein
MSLVLTPLQNLRSTGRYDRKETRASQYGALNLFIQDSASSIGIVDEGLVEKARMSNGRTLQSVALDHTAGISILNVRNVTIADQQATSKLVTFTFATYAFEFTMVPVAHDNNEVSYQKEFNQLMNERIIALGASLDSACLTVLSDAKTQVLTDTLGGKYAFTANTVIAANAQKDDIMGDINPLMHGNDFYGRLNIVGNPSVDSHMRTRLLEQAAFNDRDKSYQYQDKNFHWTNRLANGAGNAFTMYAVEEGSCGILFRPEREVLRRTIARTGHEWGEVQLPLLDIPMGTYYYESVGDYNAYNGAPTADMKRVRKQHFGFAIDVCLFTAYNSAIATKANPIMKISTTVA